MLNSWSPPLVHSSAGASHRRRGQPCQDASLMAELAGADGTALTLMAVADGHGAPAYRHSAVGSAAACQAAGEAVAEALAQPGGNWRQPDPDTLERWLARELPEVIRRRWLAAIGRHWEAQAEGKTAPPFQPRPYGTTLGLVLVTAGWWACTGLGDWDLVLIDADGARLLSQEEGLGGGGEATASLAAGGCGDGSRGGGDAPFPFRWHWFGLDPDASPFALVLSTDGIRKSCASDADFLALASWLATGMAAPALEDSLERISREGCGDDVSVAIVRWGAIGAASQPQPGVQDLQAARGPQASGLAGGDADPAPGGRISAGDRPQGSAMASVADRGTLAAGVMEVPMDDREAPGPPGGRGGPGRSTSPVQPGGRWMVAGLMGLAAVGTSIGLRLPQRLVPAGDPLAQEVERLCASPGLAAAALASRRSQFEGLRQGRLRRGDLLAQQQRDPLGALIASTFPTPTPKANPTATAPPTVSPSAALPLAAPSAASAPAAATPPPSAQASPAATATGGMARLAAPGRPCPALNQALDSLWGRSGAVPALDQGLAVADDSSGGPRSQAPAPMASPPGKGRAVAAAEGATARQEAAIRTVLALYGALARGDGASARAYLGAGAADQFDSILFRPFARVELEALRPIVRASEQQPEANGQNPEGASVEGKPLGGEQRPDQEGGTVILAGVVRLVDREGRIQRERRTFLVGQEGGVMRVTASAFGAVLEADERQRP